eukprot:637751-Pelagomonas_calceolata.AAC.2
MKGWCWRECSSKGPLLSSQGGSQKGNMSRLIWGRKCVDGPDQQLVGANGGCAGARPPFNKSSFVQADETHELSVRRIDDVWRSMLMEVYKQALHP